ncbi:MAG: ATP-dependent sacrificial sulfur transferase LarE [Desulfovibrionaceae bacterium]|nr:ATP-dependent sacrificial sulfur transferase LarE [Desulfovibrionaceae bacterium]
MNALGKKRQLLTEYLRGLGSVAVAFSGGTDSAFLLQTAHDALGDGVMAVTGCSPSFPQRELWTAQEFTRTRGIRHYLVNSEELALEDFAKNPPDRCYWCKKQLLGKIMDLAAQKGAVRVAEASNLDDENDYRPGLKAVAEMGVLSPLRLARLGKAEIRALSKEMGLPTWNKPAFACLASRFPYGERISPEGLARVDAAEQFLLDQGFEQVRVRFHEQGRLARLELDEDGLDRLADAALRRRVDLHLRELGFIYSAVDLRGYLPGSLNALLAEYRQQGNE